MMSAFYKVTSNLPIIAADQVYGQSGGEGEQGEGVAGTCCIGRAIFSIIARDQWRILRVKKGKCAD